jgi:hypothetical protein
MKMLDKLKADQIRPGESGVIDSCQGDRFLMPQRS